MSISLAISKQLAQSCYPDSPVSIDSFKSWRRKEKVVVVMGATGTGKSRLSIDLASCFPAEVINSDKIQVYQGLDIVTNKVTKDETSGIPHHLLGVVDQESDFTSTDFRYLATHALGSIVGRNHLPIIAGGSNSYIEHLVDDNELGFRAKYDCCFLWVDVSLPVLHSFVSDRVDRMVEMGLVDEVRRLFKPDGDYSRGIRRAIGVPEMDWYLRTEAYANGKTRLRMLEEAVDEIKVNTCTLARRQLEKIRRLQSLPGWKVHRLDATDVLRMHGRQADKAWDNLIAKPSSMIVGQFLYDDGNAYRKFCRPAIVARGIPVAAGTH
ncbi:hypothetical protein GIB67_028064 [Kingdonia uniflora]|uniref:adenylate dimethylallyltransferase (ADP/ATP-dependent) n=1 Tax=Kingdonia uniflora TaxID=39325 RepID=A0A7J7L1G1_9MAGN|nr:hypothetical protein GIB67_028064 [Kingdonia uniflora]